MKNIAIVISHLQMWWWAQKSAIILGDELAKRWYNIYYITFYKMENLYDFQW